MLAKVSIGTSFVSRIGILFWVKKMLSGVARKYIYLFSLYLIFFFLVEAKNLIIFSSIWMLLDFLCHIGSVRYYV